MLERICEPELMDDPEEAHAYDRINNDAPNKEFVDRLLTLNLRSVRRILDLGTGPADIPAMIARRWSDVIIDAVDGSSAMVEIARRNINRQGLGDRVLVSEQNIMGLRFPDGMFDLVLSNSLVHHLHDLSKALVEIRRVLKPGAIVFFRDLARPESLADLEAKVSLYCQNDTPLQRKMFRDSLHAAFTPDELKKELRSAGFIDISVSTTSDRHVQCFAVRPSIELIKRGDLPSLSSISSAGTTYSLGLHKDFRGDPRIKKLFPENGRLSLAWVHLEKNQELAVHHHPTASMIVVASGAGVCLGDSSAEFEDGDILLIPPHARHGFRGCGERGYWALSIQFEGLGLYEDPASPRVNFAERVSPHFEELLQLNEQHLQRYRQNPIFAFVASQEMAEAGTRKTLLRVIQPWSAAFQRMVTLRAALGKKEPHRTLAREHLLEESGHDQALSRECEASSCPVVDPVLTAIGSWFEFQMLTLDEIQRTALVHLVLEQGSVEFHGHAKVAFAHFADCEHFQRHDAADIEHVRIGIESLKDLSETDCKDLAGILDLGWKMLDVLCERMVILTREIVKAQIK